MATAQLFPFLSVDFPLFLTLLESASKDNCRCWHVRVLHRRKKCVSNNFTIGLVNVHKTFTIIIYLPLFSHIYLKLLLALSLIDYGLKSMSEIEIFFILPFI